VYISKYIVYKHMYIAYIVYIVPCESSSKLLSVCGSSDLELTLSMLKELRTAFNSTAESQSSGWLTPHLTKNLLTDIEWIHV
jgi:hypothetical protein